LAQSAQPIEVGSAAEGVMKKLLVLCFGLSGCSWTIEQCFKEKGLSRVAFDLQCPQEQVQTTFLNRSGTDQMSYGALGTQVGVKGCGKQSVYVLDGNPKSSADHWEWIANREINASR
jgi:hypothetical protein